MFKNLPTSFDAIARFQATGDAIVCCQAGLEWIAMDDVGHYNFRPRYNFNVTAVQS
jgi:hypothetical protein